MSLRRFEADLARHFTAWLPYSGPSEQDCLAEFCISRQRAAELLLAAITETRIEEYGPLKTLSEHQGVATRTTARTTWNKDTNVPRTRCPGAAYRKDPAVTEPIPSAANA